MALPDNKFRPYHVLEAKALYNTGGALNASNSYEALDQSSSIATLKTDIETIINNTDASAPDKATAISDANAKIDLHVAASVTVNITDICDQIHTDYTDLVDAEITDPKVCPECQGNGVHPTYDGNGAATGDTVESGLCNGWGKTDGQYIVNPATKTYILSS